MLAVTRRRHRERRPRVARQNANVVLTSPEMRPRGDPALSQRGPPFLRRLQYFVSTVAHAPGIYSGHDVAHVMRRLGADVRALRLVSDLLLASATIGNPASSRARCAASTSTRSRHGAAAGAASASSLLAAASARRAPRCARMANGRDRRLMTRFVSRRSSNSGRSLRQQARRGGGARTRAGAWQVRALSLVAAFEAYRADTVREERRSAGFDTWQAVGSSS